MVAAGKSAMLLEHSRLALGLATCQEKSKLALYLLFISIINIYI